VCHEPGCRTGQDAGIPVCYRCDADDPGGGVDADPIPGRGDGVVLLLGLQCRPRPLSLE
jgi:hypothetical protein